MLHVDDQYFLQKTTKSIGTAIPMHCEKNIKNLGKICPKK
jgi:hypothetical protein